MNESDVSDCDITILPELYFAKKPEDLCRINHIKAVIIYKQGINKILDYLCDQSLPIRTHQFLLSCILPAVTVHHNHDFIGQIISILSSEQLDHIKNTQLIYQLSDIIATLIIIHFKNTGEFLFEVNSIPTSFDVAVYKYIFKLISETPNLIPKEITKEEQKNRKRKIKLLHAELAQSSINSLVQSTEDSLDFFNNCLLFKKKDDVNSIVLDPEILASVESSNVIQKIFTMIQENQTMKSILGIQSLTHLTRATNCMQVGSSNIIEALMDTLVAILPHCIDMDPNIISVIAKWILSLKLNTSLFDVPAIFSCLFDTTTEIISQNFPNSFEIIKSTIKVASQISSQTTSIVGSIEQIFQTFIQNFINYSEGNIKEIYEIVKTGSLDNIMEALWAFATPSVVQSIAECIANNPGFASFHLACSLLDNRNSIPSPAAALPVIDSMYNVINYAFDSGELSNEGYAERSIMNFCIKFMKIFPRRKFYKLCESQNDYVAYVYAISRYTLLLIQKGICLDETNDCLDILFNFEQFVPFQLEIIDDFIQNIPNLPQESYVYKTACRVVLIDVSAGVALINNLAQSDKSVSIPRLKLTAGLFQNTSNVEEYMELINALINNAEPYFGEIDFTENQTALIKFIRDVADSSPPDMNLSKYSIKAFELFLRILKNCILEEASADDLRIISEAATSLLLSTLGNVGIMTIYSDLFRNELENWPDKSDPPTPEHILRASNPFEELFIALISHLKDYQPRILVQYKEMGNVLSKFLLEAYKASPKFILDNDDLFYFIVNFTRAIFLLGGKKATENSVQLVKLLLKKRPRAFGHHIILALNALSSNQDVYSLGLLINSYLEYDIALVQFSLGSFELQFGLSMYLKKKNVRGPTKIQVSSPAEADGFNKIAEECGLRKEAEELRKKMREISSALFRSSDDFPDGISNEKIITRQFSEVREMIKELGVWLDSDTKLWPVLASWDFSFESRETLMILNERNKGSSLTLLEELGDGDGIVASSESPVVLFM